MLNYGTEMKRISMILDIIAHTTFRKIIEGVTA